RCRQALAKNFPAVARERNRFDLGAAEVDADARQVLVGHGASPKAPSLAGNIPASAADQHDSVSTAPMLPGASCRSGFFAILQARCKGAGCATRIPLFISCRCGRM